MQKIELSSHPTVSITEGWRGSRSKPPQFITSLRRLRQMRRFAAVDSSSLCRESVIIVKCQCEISNQHARVPLLELEHSDLHLNFLKNFNYLGKRLVSMPCLLLTYILLRSHQGTSLDSFSLTAAESYVDDTLMADFNC